MNSSDPNSSFYKVNQPEFNSAKHKKIYQTQSGELECLSNLNKHYPQKLHTGAHCWNSKAFLQDQPEFVDFLDSLNVKQFEVSQRIFFVGERSLYP